MSLCKAQARDNADTRKGLNTNLALEVINLTQRNRTSHHERTWFCWGGGEYFTIRVGALRIIMVAVLGLEINASGLGVLEFVFL